MKFTKENERRGTTWYWCLVIALVSFLIVLGFPAAAWCSAVGETSGNMPTHGRAEAVFAYNPHNLLRLHILANSDDPTDQQLKLRVRDEFLEMTAEFFGSVRSAAEAEWLVRLHKSELETAALREVRRAGKSYGVRLEIGDVCFPDRRYGALVYPAGIYRAVQVILGEGRGANWWCVLFPPLCLDPGSGTAEGKMGKTGVTESRTGSAMVRAAAAAGVNDTSRPGDQPAGRTGQVIIGWKWLPDDWWRQVRNWFR